MSPAAEVFVGIACLGGAVMLACALFGAVSEVINRVGVRLARRAAKRIDRAPEVPLAGLDPIVVAEQFHHETCRLTETELADSARLLWSALGRETR